MANYDFQDDGRMPSWIFEIWSLCHMTCISMISPLLPRAQFHRNQTIGCWVMTKNRFSIWRPSAILHLIFFYFWSRDCCSVLNLLLCTKVHQQTVSISGRHNTQLPSPSHSVSPLATTKLYSLVTEAHVWEQRAQGHYVIDRQPRGKLQQE